MLGWMATPALRLVVDDSSEQPPYVQFADSLRLEILSGALPPGKQLPSVRALAAESGVAPGTVKSAYRVLA